MAEDYQEGLRLKMTGTKKNVELGMKMLTKAAEQGHAKAQYTVGFAHFSGNGVVKNVMEGMKWLKSAAQQGESSAQYHGIIFCVCVLFIAVFRVFFWSSVYSHTTKHPEPGNGHQNQSK